MAEHVNGDQQSSLAVLMFTDIVDSAGLKKRHGPASYGEMLRRHHVMFQNIIDALPEAQILQATGDEIFSRLPTASYAVDAALRFQYVLSREEQMPEPIAVRIGIHMGEVLENNDGTVVGLAIDLAKRVQSLAMPRQILLTRAAYDDARQFIRQHPSCCGEEDLPDLQWKAHGPYRIQGLEDEDAAIDIFEVGAEGIAPLTPPPDSEKAVRAVTAAEEDNFGWRPAAGLEIPGQRGWIIEAKLGEGGYGEVWLGIQKQTMGKRAFKFCFDAERVRALDMELMSHRILLKNLGERDDIAQLIDVQLDAPPFYLVSEYSAEGDLVAWFERQGGVHQVPLEVRLDLFVRACRAVAAAHGVGALHRDLKPSNILVFTRDGQPRPKIADFGISVLTEKGREHAIEDTYAPRATELSSTRSTGTGSQLYIPPEQQRHPPPEFTPQGDVYALGVILYQLVAGDLAQPLGHGWEKDVRDPLLREDIARAVDADLAQRFSSPNELADRIKRLSGRRRARRVRQWSMSALAAALVLSLGGFLYSMQQQLIHLRGIEGIQLVWHEMMKAADPAASGFDPSIDSVLNAGITMMDNDGLKDLPRAEAEARLRLGRTFIGRDRRENAEEQIERARDLYAAINDPVLVAAAEHHLAYLYRTQGKREQSESLFRRVLEDRERLLGERHPDTALTRYELSVTLRGLNKLDESGELLQQAMDDAEAWSERFVPKSVAEEGRLREINIEIARMYNSKSRLLKELGDLDEAEAAANESLERRTNLLGEQHRDVTRSMDTLARLTSERGDLEGAERIQRDLLAIRKELLGEEHREVASTKWWIAIGLLRQRKYDEAATFAENALEIRLKVFDPDTTEVAEARALLGRLRLEQGRYEEALELLRAAFETASTSYTKTDDWRYHNIAGALAAVLVELDECEEAQPLLRDASDFVEDNDQVRNWFKRLTHHRMDRSREKCGETIANTS